MRHTEYKHNIVWVAWTSLLNFVAKHSLYRRGKQKAHQWRKTTNEWGKTSWKKTIAVKTTGTNKTKCSLCAMKLKKNKRPYWTYWFLVWHQTHLPEDRWPATGTGSGLCGWLWMTSVSGSPRSRYQSVTQWTCRLWTATKTSSALNNQVHLPNAFLWKNKCSFLYGSSLAVSLPTVSMVSLSSIRSWALGMSMCMRSVCCCLFIGSAGRVFLLVNTKHKGTLIIRNLS